PGEQKFATGAVEGVGQPDAKLHCRLLCSAPTRGAGRRSLGCNVHCSRKSAPSHARNGSIIRLGNRRQETRRQGDKRQETRDRTDDPWSLVSGLVSHRHSALGTRRSKRSFKCATKISAALA